MPDEKEFHKCLVYQSRCENVSFTAIKQLNGSTFESKHSNEVLVTWDRPALLAPSELNILKTEKNDTTRKSLLYRLDILKSRLSELDKKVA